MALILVTAVLSSASAKTGDGPSSFVPVWIGTDGLLSQESVDRVTQRLGVDGEEPEHIVVLVHGFATTKEAGKAEFETVAKRVKIEFEEHGRSVKVVGLQWDSAAGGFPLFLPRKYRQKTLLARKIGRGAARKLLIGIQESFPNSQLSIMAHSMGCELSAAAVNLDLQFDDETSKLACHRSEVEVKLTGLIFCGSDLDYDAMLGSEDARLHSAKVLWITLSQLLGSRRDSTLDLRALIRGRAMGSALPRMTTEQFDSAFGCRRIMFDRQHIPVDHSFVKYYKAHRLSRIIPTIIHYGSPDTVEAPPDVAAVDEVFAAAGDFKALQVLLDHELASARVYAIWEIEKIYCGRAHHFGDGYLQDTALELRRTPRKAQSRSKEQHCELVEQGIFPTKLMFERAGVPKWSRR